MCDKKMPSQIFKNIFRIPLVSSIQSYKFYSVWLFLNDGHEDRKICNLSTWTYVTENYLENLSGTFIKDWITTHETQWFKSPKKFEQPLLVIG